MGSLIMNREFAKGIRDRNVERHEGALSGVRVVDFTRILSGPFASMTLGDLGADVVKIERPDGGDDTRKWTPPAVGAEASYFLSVNRNKRSITLDLKSDYGHRVAVELIRNADVLLENFRPGTMVHLGLGYDDVSRINPRIIYASISGFGQTGPDAQSPGYDAIAQGRSGLMSICGDPDGSPARVGNSPADLGAGMWALVGILSALYRRTSTGRGQWIDVSLLDGQVSWLTYIIAGYFASGKRPRRYGSAHPTLVPYQGFATSDGDILVAVGNDGIWERFAKALDEPGLASDERFLHNDERYANQKVLVPMIAEALLKRTTGEWLRILKEARVPASPINTVDLVPSDPQVIARNLIATMVHPTAGEIRMVNCPIKMSESDVSARLPPPLLGQHTEEIMAELGILG